MLWNTSFYLALPLPYSKSVMCVNVIISDLKVLISLLDLSGDECRPAKACTPHQWALALSFLRVVVGCESMRRFRLSENAPPTRLPHAACCYVGQAKCAAMLITSVRCVRNERSQCSFRWFCAKFLRGIVFDKAWKIARILFFILKVFTIHE